MQFKRAPRRATSDTVTRVLHAAIPNITVEQMRKTRFWLCEADEPFAEIDLVDDGTVIHARFSAHCAPQWAAIATAALHQAGATTVGVYPDVFIQTPAGSVLYGADAVDFYKYMMRTHQIRESRLTRLDIV